MDLRRRARRPDRRHRPRDGRRCRARGRSVRPRTRDSAARAAPCHRTRVLRLVPARRRRSRVERLAAGRYRQSVRARGHDLLRASGRRRRVLGELDLLVRLALAERLRQRGLADHRERAAPVRRAGADRRRARPRRGRGAVSLPVNSIRRDSPVPFYFQLSELLEQEVTSGRWEPGFRLPSEPELCRSFGLSRTTIRQALGRLEQEGLIERRKGQGTFVSKSRPRSWLLQSSAGFFQEEVERGGRMVTSVVMRSVTRGPLPPWATSALGLGGAEGATLERVRSIDGL